MNDCHCASGMEAEKRPSKWMATQSSQELIDELAQSSKTGLDGKQPFSENYIEPMNVINGGNNPGTYAIKEFVYAYAM